MIIFVYEGLILKYNNIESARNIYFTSILIVPVIFIKILQSKKTISYRMSNLFRSLSLGIYCSHALFIMIFNTLYQIDILEYFLIKRFLFVCITSIFYSYILYKIKNKKKSFKYVSIE